MKTAHFKIVLIGLLIFIYGCMATETDHTQTVPQAIANPSKIIEKTVTLEETITSTSSLPPTLSPSLTPPHTPTVLEESHTDIAFDAHLSIHCLELEKEFPVDYKGLLLIHRYNEPAQNYILNIQSMESRKLDGKRGYVSPDGSRIAYGGNSYGQLKIASTNSDIVSETTYSDFFFGWLNETSLVFMGNENPYILKLPNFIKQQLDYDFPDKYINTISKWNPWWQGWGNAIFDGSLTRVIYLKENKAEETYSYAIWDLENNRLLGTYFLYSPYGPIYPVPNWSPDKNHFIVAGYKEDTLWMGEMTFELYKISRDGGDKEQLTFLTNYYPQLYIQNYSWSPDGKRIAMWLNTTPDIMDESAKGIQLAILDINTLQTTNYCIEGTGGKYRANSGMESINTPPPIWSPDGTKLVFADSYEENKGRIVLVDLIKERAYILIDNMWPIGWLKTE